jgi:hypothetical protein
MTGELSLLQFNMQRQLTEITDSMKVQQDKYVSFQEKERVLFEQLQQKYGTGNINFETGEIVE